MPFTPHSALRNLQCLSPFPISDVAFSQQVMHNGVCASVHVKSHQIPSNSSQNRSKRRRFPSKRDQKSAHFVMPILTFWGVTPSGASARADFAFRKGHFRCVWGSKMACGKVIHKMWKTGNRDSGIGIRKKQRPGIGVRQRTNDKGPMTSKQMARATPAHSVPQSLRHSGTQALRYSGTCRRAA